MGEWWEARIIVWVPGMTYQVPGITYAEYMIHVLFMKGTGNVNGYIRNTLVLGRGTGIWLVLVWFGVLFSFFSMIVFSFI